MSAFWSDLVRDLSPYVPGEQPQIAGLVKLNTNENPFGPSPHAIAAMHAAASDSLRLYPDPQSMKLRETLARYHGVSAEEVFVGNGSDEVLAHAFVALLKHAQPLRFPDITYSFYPVYCRLYGVARELVPLDSDLRVNVDDYLSRPGPVIIANPNAPTGVALPRADIERLAAGRPEAPVVIDEAYIDFGGETAIPLIRKYPNLLIVQTMSKSRALAGLRVGYAIGAPDLIEALTRVKDSFNSYPLNRISQAGAIASIEDEAYFQETRAKVIANRAKTITALEQLGFQVPPSGANFIFARHPDHAGAALMKGLRERAVLVRHFSGARIADYLRITIGAEDEMARLIAALREMLGGA
jgi:histidinol-phosphate aminotransferase